MPTIPNQLKPSPTPTLPTAKKGKGVGGQTVKSVSIESSQAAQNLNHPEQGNRT